MKRIYDKVASLQNWRLSVASSFFKRNSNASDDDDDKTKGGCSSDDECGTIRPQVDTENVSASIATDDVDDIFEQRALPDGESDTKVECCGNIYADLETDRHSSTSDSSETYKFLDSSPHIDPECEQRYQNIIDMSEEIEMIKKRNSTRCCSQERNVEDGPSVEATDKRSSTECTAVPADPKGNHASKDSIADMCSDEKDGKSAKKPDLTKLKSKREKKRKTETAVVQNEYDIPKITFSFLDSPFSPSVVESDYEPLTVNKPAAANDTNPETKNVKCKSEIRIVLSPIKDREPETTIEPIVENKTEETKPDETCVDVDDVVECRRFLEKEKSKSNDDIKVTETDVGDENKKRIGKSLSDLGATGSVKNIPVRFVEKSCTLSSKEEAARRRQQDDAKKPNKRASKSLTEIFDASDESTIRTSVGTKHVHLRSLNDIDKVSDHAQSQRSTNDSVDAQKSNEDLEYCKARDKLPMKVRRATLVKRTFIRSRAADGWSNFRTRISNIITAQAAAQRVGAQSESAVCIADEYPKASESVNKFYKKTKKKLSTLSKLNGKLATKKRRDRSGDSLNTYDLRKESIDEAQSECDYARSECCRSGSSVSGSVDANLLISGSMRRLAASARSVTGDDDKLERDFKTTFRRSKFVPLEGQNGFDDLRRYVKQGGDFCKELSSILHERADVEMQYAKTLAKLSGKLTRACRDGVGDVNDTWKAVASEMEKRADAHRVFSTALNERCVRPLRTLSDVQSRVRKQVESSVDKSTRSLGDWRSAEAKAKKSSHGSARENEKLQDALLDVRLTRSSSLIHLPYNTSHKNNSDKETAKLELKRRKAEDSMKKADIEYYTLCIRAERARLEWESAVLRGIGTFQTLEEERLNSLKVFLTSFLSLTNDLCPKIMECAESLRGPITQCDATKDLQAFISLQNSSQNISEQLLPDFYCEHITLAMNRERRKQALVKLLQLIRQDLDRERKSKVGLENLSLAIKQTPNFGTEDSQQTVNEKLHHMCSMLTYLEGARYKVQSVLAEIDNRQRISHPLATHITITRDKSGLQQSILKVPPWLRAEEINTKTGSSCANSLMTDNGITDWSDRGVGDGNSNQPDSDFDEFSSHSSCSASTDHGNLITDNTDLCRSEDVPLPAEPLCHCRALYAYTARLTDEISLRPGDILTVYRQQPDGWWLGECNGNVGIFPATYVEIQSS